MLSYLASGAAPVNPDTLTHGFRALCEAMEQPELDKLRESIPKGR